VGGARSIGGGMGPFGIAVTVAAALACATATHSRARSIEKSTVRSGDVDVPIEVARPVGAGPFAPLLYIHARRGLEDEDRKKIVEFAGMGFLVVAPDWQSGRFLERWPVAHDPATEGDVEAALDHLAKRGDACRMPVGIVGYSRGPYYAIRLAAKRPKDIAAIVSYYGHMQNPNAPEPEQVFRVAPEVLALTTPMLILIGDEDFELRRMSAGRAFYALYERGVPVEIQMYPMARRAFDFRVDQTPEEKIATRHARERARDWLYRWMKLGPRGECT
jgi:carboxymethylenebutenolidase